MAHEEFAETVNGVLLVKRRKDAEIRDMTLLDFNREYARGTVFSAGCRSSTRRHVGTLRHHPLASSPSYE